MNREGFRAECTDDGCIIGIDGSGATKRIHAEFFISEGQSADEAHRKASGWAEMHAMTWGHFVNCKRFIRMAVNSTDVNPELSKAIWGE